MKATVLLEGTVSKGPDWECQDAFAADPDKGCVAVADGVTNRSFMSRHYSQRLVDTYVSIGGAQIHRTSSPMQSLRQESMIIETMDDRAVPEFAETVRREWRRDVEEGYLPLASEHQRYCWRNGDLSSFATFAGMQCEEKDGGNLVVTVLAVGDCYAFVGGENSSAKIVTGAEAGTQFRTEATCVGASDNMPFVKKLRVVRFQVDEPVYVLLTTDFLGRQLHRRLQSDGSRWQSTLEELARLKHQSDLLRWVHRKTQEEKIDSADDASVMLVKVERRSCEAAEEQAQRTAFEEPAGCVEITARLPDTTVISPMPNQVAEFPLSRVQANWIGGREIAASNGARWGLGKMMPNWARKTNSPRKASRILPIEPVMSEIEGAGVQASDVALTKPELTQVDIAAEQVRLLRSIARSVRCALAMIAIVAASNFWWQRELGTAVPPKGLVTTLASPPPAGVPVHVSDKGVHTDNQEKVERSSSEPENLARAPVGVSPRDTVSATAGGAGQVVLKRKLERAGAKPAHVDQNSQVPSTGSRESAEAANPDSPKPNETNTDATSSTSN